MRIKVGDLVVVIAGNDRGVRGKVLSVQADAGKLVVEGVNRVMKHVRRSQKNPQGGRLSKEMPLHAGNVMLVCPSCSAGTRVGARRTEAGAKERYCKKCGASIGQITPPREGRVAGTAGRR